jgi:hypothetical protein
VTLARENLEIEGATLKIVVGRRIGRRVDRVVSKITRAFHIRDKENREKRSEMGGKVARMRIESKGMAEKKGSSATFPWTPPFLLRSTV